MNYQVEAIVLKSWDSKEYDRIYEVFSKEKGKMRIIAKGVRKSTARLANGLEPITRSVIYLFKGRTLDRVVGVLTMENFIKIKNNLETIQEVNRVVNIIRNFIKENESDLEIYKHFITYLSKAWQKNDLLKLFFLWKIIKESGYQFQFYYCIQCQKKLEAGGANYFLPSKGIGCQNCFNPSNQYWKISDETIKLLRIFNEKNERIIEKIKTDKQTIFQLATITRISLEEILGKRVCL